MAEPEVDDIFKDFEYKVKGKKEAKEAQKQPVRQIVDDEEEEKPKKQGIKQERLPPKQIPNYEKIAYIAIILVLVAYAGIDWMYYHNEDTKGESSRKISVTAVTGAGEDTMEANKTATAKNETAVTANKSAENNASGEVKSEAAKAEEKQLSGAVTLSIIKVYTSLSKSINDTGYIDRVEFTIENGKVKTLNPKVDVYAYDSEIDKAWETKSRGQYLGAAIGSGEKQTGSISLSPKTFKKLNLKKSLRLNLNDTNAGFIGAVNEDVIIS